MADRDQHLRHLGEQPAQLLQGRHRLAEAGQPVHPAGRRLLGAGLGLHRRAQTSPSVPARRSQQLAEGGRLAVPVIAQQPAHRLGEPGRLPGLGQHLVMGARLGK
ncbi:hypothetical protein LN042_26980 [Kitasatospora sp. RB6PN24]|nr:hypothetical protein [Kitasatospora humi]MCC9310672.1 hypothetical protein [Kitasatospora humi]